MRVYHFLSLEKGDMHRVRAIVSDNDRATIVNVHVYAQKLNRIS